ncbi:uncharacterized protein MELLADRAFT_104839 [Melampsora larici-populina 98AG31]|uniref:Uncharacterized protein n=1 Tax=Melampsora larici-populina (strain 98AG31 / pathotype 3-4-7) TaxID=747676 RepID=F4RFX5_MELLP|nr:uncharacterized protein MELLADRAFT_104839 [Melampsora larici-populina 98AG31]EGG08683.1 hypothetical protein MELLADRAFT_104839 [Melampsora larici-populina 98AG31]
MSWTPPDKPTELSSIMQSAEHLTPWPQWASTNCTRHTVIPGFQTLTSPKSLYRLADMLIIPELKATCHKQIIESLAEYNVISETKSSLFAQHEELRVEAYKLIRQNWQKYWGPEIVPSITNLSPEEASLFFKHVLKGLAP